MKRGLTNIFILFSCIILIQGNISTVFAVESNERKLTCEMVEHIHTDSCWPETGDGPICGYFEHVHNEECYESNTPHSYMSAPTGIEEPGIENSWVYGDGNPKYLLQHFYSFPRVVLHNSGTLPIIDVSLGVPENGKALTSAQQKFLNLNQEANGQYSLQTEEALVRLFADEYTEYNENSDIMQMDRLFNSLDEGKYNPNYTLKEIWVGTRSQSEDTEKSHFAVFPVKMTATGHDPNSIGFTNNPDNPYITVINADKSIGPKNTSNKYPYEYTILISSDTLIRLVFDTTVSEDVNISSLNFFDYDISDGNIYTDNATKNRHNTSEQTNTSIWYTLTNQQGINSPSNYVGYTGSQFRYGFGNANTNNGVADDIWRDGGVNNTPNKYNRVDGNFKGLTFNLTTGYNESGDELTPKWNSNIVAPNLFGLYDTNTVGKTVWCDDEFSMGYYRRGSTYTLDNIKYLGTPVAPGLRDFTRRVFSASNIIYSNDFWPADYAPTFGADGHDMVFGSKTYVNYRKLASSATKSSVLPQADDELDHNSYFGMSFSVEFRIDPGYVGPLDYLFFGDDDMWVYLDEINGTADDVVRIVDIGGVHSSAGEYVNIWNYIDPIPYGGESKSYRLIFFYTERGASGSTCYMRFTLPLDFDLVTDADTTGLVIEKSVVNGTVEDQEREFPFECVVADVSGVSLYNMYDYKIYNRDTGEVVSTGVLVPYEAEDLDTTKLTYHFTLTNKQYIVIEGLPTNRAYRIGEANSDEFTIGWAQGMWDQKGNPEIDSNGYDEVTGMLKHNYINFINTYPEARELPVTGGPGLAIIYSVGAFLVLLGVICLVWRKYRK